LTLRAVADAMTRFQSWPPQVPGQPPRWPGFFTCRTASTASPLRSVSARARSSFRTTAVVARGCPSSYDAKRLAFALT